MIPNEILIAQTVVNHTHTDFKVCLGTQVQVGYGSDIEQAMRILVDVARQHPRVLADPPPVALLSKFAGSGIDLELGFWIGDPENGSANVRSELNIGVYRAFGTAGISIAYPRMMVAVERGEKPPAA